MNKFLRMTESLRAFSALWSKYPDCALNFASRVGRKPEREGNGLPRGPYCRTLALTIGQNARIRTNPFLCTASMPFFSAHNQGILTTSGETNKNKPPTGRHMPLESPRTCRVRLGVCHVRPCVCRVCLVGCDVFSRAINRELIIGRVEYGTLARVGVWPGLPGCKRLRFGNVLHGRTA